MDDRIARCRKLALTSRYSNDCHYEILVAALLPLREYLICPSLLLPTTESALGLRISVAAEIAVM